jgi:hypothetical protein
LAKRVKFLPPYSPDLSPIELCWSKLKEILGSAKNRTWDALDEAVTRAVNVITDEKALNWFNHCGFFLSLFRELVFVAGLLAKCCIPLLSLWENKNESQIFNCR